ncbi:MAG: NifU family protein [Bacteroidetes bacterium]|nr:NifU family protein [Bacteroidota bacterium]
MNTTEVTADDLKDRVEASLDNIRPYLEADGGNIKVLEITADKMLKLEFIGNCNGCPMSTMTFKAGVEEAVKRLVPEIKGILVTNLS